MSENGKRLIDKIIAKAATGKRSIVVPEWDGVELFFEPLTRAKMEEAMPKDKVDRPFTTQSLFLLVFMAKDASGHRVFKQGDIEALRTQADLGVLSRVEAFMWGTVLPNEKQVEEMVEADPPSASV
jgi:hypothetical protein